MHCATDAQGRRVDWVNTITLGRTLSTVLLVAHHVGMLGDDPSRLP